VNLDYSLDGIYFRLYNFAMSWDVEYTNAFECWWKTLTEKEQVSPCVRIDVAKKEGEI